MKKQNFLHGAALLAMATAVVKLIGAAYKLPLKMAIGDQGYSYFTTAYDIYSVLLLISTAGLPVAMSRMISAASSLGNYNQVRRVYKTSRGIFLILGAAGSALMIFGCQWLAGVLNQPDAWTAILCLGPCSLLMSVISTYRGFFQGQSNMQPTSISQIIEAVFKLFVGLAVAFAVMHFTNSIPLAAAGAILGVTVGCVASAIYLRCKQAPAYRDLPKTNEAVLSYGATAKELLSIAVPVTIGAAGLQFLMLAESGLYMEQMIDLFRSRVYLPFLLEDGLSAQAAADTVKGIYNLTQTIFNMPCAFMTPLATSVLPAITAHLTLKNHQAVRSTEESAARVTALVAMPCAVGLSVLARPIMALLGGYTGNKLDLATQLLCILGVVVFLNAVVLYTNVVLQSHGKAHFPVIHMLLFGTLKLAVVYVLVGNPAIGILGAPFGAILSYLCIGGMNLVSIHKIVPQKPQLLKNLLKPLLPAILMGVSVFASYKGLVHLLGEGGSRLILCCAPIVVGVAVYFVCVVLFKTITREDCLLLPKGEKIAKLLRL